MVMQMSTTVVSSDVAHSTRSVLSSLESLRQEHHLILSSSIDDADDDDDDKRQYVQQSSESIELGIDEAQVMLTLETYLDNLDSETHKLILQVQRLTQENNWLRDELSLTEKHLQASTHMRDDYEHDIQLFNEYFASAPPTANEPFHLTDSIDIDKEMPIEPKERLPVLSNLESKTQAEIPPRFRTLHNLVIQYAQAGRYEVAVPLCRQALEDLEKTHGHNHPDVATMLNILALVYRDQNKFKEALQLLTEALSIREKTLGFDHPAVAATLNNLAVLYGKKNRYKEAEPLCKRALEIREKCFGADHPDVGKQLNNLALLCLNQGKYDKVEEYYRRAIDIYSKHYGQNDDNVTKTKNNLASAYLREGKYTLAGQLYQEVLAESSSDTIRDSTMIATTLKNLGALCRRQGLYEPADSIESCAAQLSENPSDAIQRALTILRKLRIYDDASHDAMRRSQQTPTGTQEYGKLRRSGSFQKLRQSIRRGSEKLVQKLRGTPANLPLLNSTVFTSQEEGPLKRASSMSVLNHVTPSYPLQQQQTNRTLTTSNSIDRTREDKLPLISTSRTRLVSAENLH